METGDAPADAAVFAMVVLLVNLQNNIIPSTTNQMISRNNLPMVASEKKKSHIVVEELARPAEVLAHANSAVAAHLGNLKNRKEKNDKKKMNLLDS